MGAWGYGLYSNDDTLDIRDSYVDMLTYGYSSDAAISEIVREYELESDKTESAYGWLALADTAWRYGRLSEPLKERAISIIDSEIDDEKWKTEPSTVQNKRKAMLEKLKTKLNSPQPKARKPRKERFCSVPWKTGDIYTFPIMMTDQYGAILVVEDYFYQPSKYAPVEDRVHQCGFVFLDWHGNPERLKLDLMDRIPVLSVEVKKNSKGETSLRSIKVFHESFKAEDLKCYSYAYSISSAVCANIVSSVRPAGFCFADDPASAYDSFQRENLKTTVYFPCSLSIQGRTQE